MSKQLVNYKEHIQDHHLGVANLADQPDQKLENEPQADGLNAVAGSRLATLVNSLEEQYQKEGKSEVAAKEPSQCEEAKNLQMQDPEEKEYSAGLWSETERKRFFTGVKKYGRDWHRVQELVRTRSRLQVQRFGWKLFQRLKIKMNN